MASAFPTIRPPKFLLFEPHQPELCNFTPSVFLDITSVFEKKQAAMAEMKAQKYLQTYYAQRAEQRGNHARRVSGDQRDSPGRGVHARRPGRGAGAVSEPYDELARLGSATVFEASGRVGLIDLDLHQVIPGSRAAGPARTVRCAQDDILMVHAAMDRVEPGDVLVLTMPEPRPVALLGELLATQAKGRGAAAVLIDAAVRDTEELRELGIPVWARWIRVQGADRAEVGEIDVPVEVGSAAISPGDAVVLDADGAVVVASGRLDEVAQASRERAENEDAKRARFKAGELSYDMYGLREQVEGE